MQFSLNKLLWFAASKTRGAVENYTIYVFRYLLTGALVIVIKRFVLKKTNKMTIKMSKAVRLDLALAYIMRFKSPIQMRNQGLPASSALLSRQHLDLTAISRRSLLMQRMSLSLLKTERLQDRACPGEDSMSRLQINNQKLTYIRKTESTKRIEFSEMLEEDEKVEKHGLVST